MNLNLFQWRSLKTRVTLFTLAIFMVSIWSLAFYASRMLREDMVRLLGEQQFSTASLLAKDINGKLDDRFSALATVAGTMTPAMLGNTAALQSLLEQNTVFQRLFNGGTFVTRLDGTATASVPLAAGRANVNYMDRDYIAAALKEGRATIGRPVMGRKLQAPIFGMAAPIRDVQGKVIGVLAGVTDLSQPNFLDRITEGSYGKSGAYLLAAPRHNLFVTASDKSRIMRPLPTPGINPLHDKYAKGYEGYGVLVNFRGEEELTAAKGIPVAGWFLGIALPTTEAFAPIRAMQQRMLLAAILLTLLAGGLTWWMLRRQLLPMLAAVKTLATLADSDQPAQPLPITSQDEIAELIAGFNRLLETSAQRETLIRQILDTSSVAIFLVDKEGRITQANQRMAQMFGCSLDALLGNEYVALVPPAEREIGRQKMHALLASEIESVDLERLYWRADHTEFWGNLTGKRFTDASGEERGLVGVIADITERKRIEGALQNSEAHYRSFVAELPLGIVITQDGLIKYANRAIVEMIGYPENELLGRPFLPLVDEADRPRLMDLHRRRMSGAEIERSYVVGMVRKDGEVRQWQGYVNTIDWDGKPSGLGSFIDITDRKQAEEELRIAAAAFESQQGMMITDASHVIVRVNRAFTEMTGYTAGEAIGQTPAFLRSGRHDAIFFAEMWERIRHTGGWQGEIWERRKNGEIYPKWLTITALKSDDGTVTHYVSTHTDITARKAAEEEIINLAFYDTLTQLPNRRLLMDRLQQALASSSRSGHDGALFFLDLDNFKTLNDTLGHDKGDLLLQQVAKRLVTCVREGDTVARLGGDEFVVMLEGLSENSADAATQAETLGEKILATLNQPYRLAGYEKHSTSSIGVTLFSGHQSSMEELLMQADLAMYQSKAAGRNTLRFFDPRMQAMVSERAALEIDLRAAVSQRQFVLYYQPQVVGEGRLTGAEALVRWQHPQRGLVLPAEFIALAEETNLILPLGLWVLETACTQLARWATQASTARLTLAVNVSANQLHQTDFVDQVLAVLAKTGANPHRLKLELTESLLVSHVENSIAKMTALKAQGVGFSMDDFGTGYSSLSSLKRLPLDQLKIDQGFVRDLLIDPNDAAIAKMVIALAESLGLTVIAEGVEIEAQRDFLARLGCHAYQGYLFSPPLPLDEFEAFVKRADPG